MTLSRGTTEAARFRSRIKANTDPAGMFSLAAILRPDKTRQRPRARAWDGTDPRRRCDSIKTIDENVRPNNRLGADDHRRLRSPNAYFHATDSATDLAGTKTQVRTAFTWKNAFAPLAQLGEQLTLNQPRCEAITLELRFTLPIRARVTSMVPSQSCC